MRNNYLIKSIIMSLLLIISASLQAQVKAMWVTSWDLTNEAQIDTMLSDMYIHGYNQVLAEIRYRGDALYTPNKLHKDFPNPEPKCFFLKDSNFDALGYLIEKAKPLNIEVYAWVTTFVVTPKNSGKISDQNVYLTNPEWIITDKDNNPMSPDVLEGAYLDPANPLAQDYLFNVFMDIITNYDIDGFHLDYVRYPGQTYGNYSFNSGDADSYQLRNLKQEQVTRFVKRLYAESKLVKPTLDFTAAVVAEISNARSNYAQDWLKWISEGYLDKVYLMAYTTSDESLKVILDSYPSGIRNKIIVGLRAWAEKTGYSEKKITSKISMVVREKYQGYSLFSYSGLKNLGHFHKIFPLVPAPDSLMTFPKIAFGYLQDSSGNHLPNHVIIDLETNQQSITDANGFYFFILKDSADFYTPAVNLSASAVIIGNTYETDGQRIFRDEFIIDTKFHSDSGCKPDETTLDQKASAADTDKHLSNSLTNPGVSVEKKSDSENFKITIVKNSPGNINIRISGQDGKLVYSFSGWLDQGIYTEEWNGTDMSGIKVKEGNYQLYYFSETEKKEMVQTINIF